MKRIIVSLVVLAVCLPLAACASDADKVSSNLSTAAEQFEVQRKIVAINGITDKVLFTVEGRCSLESGESLSNVLDVICKQGPNLYKKHFIGLSDNVTFVAVQTESLPASVYHTRIIIKPENIVPNLDLVTGDR